MIYENAIYVKNKNFIFVYIPKVACTNWKSIIRYFIGADDYLNPKLAHDNQNSGLIFLDSKADRKIIIADSIIKKYTFVRNPFSRVLPAFLNKFSKQAYEYLYFKAIQDEVKIYQVEVLHNTGVEIAFYTFLHWLKYSDSIYKTDPHWISQTDIIGDDLSIYDFIGRFENLVHDSQIILDAIECDIMFPTQEDVKFKPTNATDKIAIYYAQKEIDLVLDIYKKDFELLGYSTSIEDIKK